MEGVPGVMPCVALVEVTGAGVISGVTTGGGVGVALASVFELPRLQPAKARGKLTDRSTMRNLFWMVFIDDLSLVELNTGELIYFPTLSTVSDNGKSCHGVLTPLVVVPMTTTVMIMNLIVFLIVLMLLFGGGGFYLGGLMLSGIGFGLVLLICLILLFQKRSDQRPLRTCRPPL